jgi:hypothetical protein
MVIGGRPIVEIAMPAFVANYSWMKLIANQENECA